DVLIKSLEQRDALCSYNEHSDVVWVATPRLSYKDFVGTKPACERTRADSCSKEGKSFMREVRPVLPGPQFAAFVGIDWADQKHVWCLQAAGSEQRESGELEHSPEAVEAWVGQLCQRFASGPIAVAIEQSRGALVFMLSKYEPLHLFPVPSQMSAS